MRAADDLPDEFAGPVAYADRWLWIAVALIGVVVLYYLACWWFTRPPKERTIRRLEVSVPDVRLEHLGRIDQVVARVQLGELSPRDGHQQLSEVLRSYVASVTTLPARTMALADFRNSAPQPLVDAIELMYPPEFAPDDALAEQGFESAAQASRHLVGSWA
ncbi:MAG: hypothetical protein L0H31_06235 [Nocardioidaceae bacterium]|nr:hypothetical protein [Nocardioidaceae bacterium]